jgi:hypothetical protein
MRLYIANCTRQFQQVHYRLDIVDDAGRKDSNSRFQPSKQQTIAPGRQVALGGDLDHPSQITDIIDQLRRHGLAGVEEINRLKGVVPYLCSTDKPVPASAIRQVMEHNKGIRIDQGQQRRARAAVAVTKTVEDAVAAQAAAQGLKPPEDQNVEVEFEQVEQSEAGESTIAEGYRVDENAPLKPTKGPIRGGKHGRGKG